MEKIYSEDEIKDRAVIKEYAKKNTDPEELAKKLTEYFTKKYGAYFGGSVKFEYMLAENKFKMKCNQQEREFEMNELDEIPSQIAFLKKTASHKK